MSKWKYANPRHDCPALGIDAIIPKVCRSQPDGSIKPWGFKCPFCSQGRKFTAAEEADYLAEMIEESETSSNSTHP